MRVQSGVFDAILAHARAASPEECCGVLVGQGDRIDEAVPARNIAAQPTTRFLIDPKNHLDALRAARGRGLDVVGFYHSHPHSGAMPSATDLAEATYPDCVHAIAGLGSQPPDVRLFRIADGNFLAIEYVTVR